MGLEAVVAFGAGALWYAVGAVLLGGVLPHGAASVIAVLVLDVAVVLAVTRYWGIGYAVTIGIASVVALDWHYIPPTHTLALPDPRNSVALTAYLVTGVLLGLLAVLARRRAEVSEDARHLLADEQDALRRVATSVAEETAPMDVFASVTEEVGRLLALDLATLWRFEDDDTATVVGAWSAAPSDLRVGTRLRIEGDNVLVAVRRGSGPARADRPGTDGGQVGERLRTAGVRSSVGTPLLVDGRLWGVMVAASRSGEPIAPHTESRLREFTSLAATAVANAEAREELAASRARVVAAADRGRRDIERDLHDGVQQRLVALGLDLRVAEDLAVSGSEELLPTLTTLREGLVASLEELREIAHGIHPAVLSDGGLRPALANLARRSPVPVELEIDGVGRLPEQLEVGAYYVASEALANVIKHADATQVRVRVATEGPTVRLEVADDGVGGADPGKGSGLLGLVDRVHALGGSLEVHSPPGVGTSLTIVLPVGDVADTGTT